MKKKQYWKDQERKKKRIRLRKAKNCNHYIVTYNNKSFCLTCKTPVEETHMAFVNKSTKEITSVNMDEITKLTLNLGEEK